MAESDRADRYRMVCHRNALAPDFFVVGHAKSGTTALYEMLRQHPEIYMPPIKEVRYFCADINAVNGRPVDMTFDQYVSLFAGADPQQITGEATSGNLASDVAAREIAAVNPAARIIAILREPASYIYALHQQRARRGGWRRIDDIHASMRAEPWRYPQRVRYVDQLERYRAVFPESQILVLIYDDYRQDNLATLQRLFRFLGVDDSFEPVLDRSNPSVTIRVPVLAALRTWLVDRRGPVPSAMMGLIDRSGIRHPTRFVYRRLNYMAPIQPDAELMADLRAMFAPEVQKASDYLGRDLFALWGYGSGEE